MIFLIFLKKIGYKLFEWLAKFLDWIAQTLIRFKCQIKRCFESFPFRQNFVIFVRQITWFRWTNRHWTSGVNVHNKNSKSICAILTFDPQLKKNRNIFCKRQILIKLFYLYQRLQCRDKYFFKIKFVFFLYLRLSASSKENDLPLCIYFWYQTDSGVPNISIYSAVSLASPYYDYLFYTASTTMICWLIRACVICMIYIDSK